MAEEASKQVMYDWLEIVETYLEHMREHIEPLPEGEEGWEEEHFEHAAHIMVHCANLGRRSALLSRAIGGALANKMRYDAEAN